MRMDDAAIPEHDTAWRARLRRALHGGASPAAAAGDHPGLTGERSATHAAAVLIPVVAAPEPFIWFTQRSAALRHHPGQISFPGGRVEAFDADAKAAALREAHEEIGLAPHHVEIIGELPEYRTVTSFAIRPYVGWVDPVAAAEVAPDETEVARLFGVPLEYALDHRHFRYEPIERGGRPYRVYSIDYDDNHIWGATAGMLYGLLDRLATLEAGDDGRRADG